MNLLLEEQQVADLKEWLICQRDACDELHGNDCKDERCMSNRITLASLESPPAGKFVIEPVENRYHHIKHGEYQYTEPKLPMVRLYTAPPVPVLRLPGEPSMDDFYGNVPGGNQSEPDDAGFAMWKAAIAQLQRLNAGAQVVKPVKLPDRLLPANHRSGEAFMAADSEGNYLNREFTIKAIRAAGGEVAE